MSNLPPTVRVAAVQAAPVFLDRAASVARAVELIEEAGSRGVQLIGFPEGFVPGHPGWVEIQAFDDKAQELGRRLFSNAVEVDSDHLNPVKQACRDNGVTAVLGICERRPATTGTLFNSQVHIGIDGSVTCHHQKFVPTIGERIVHAPGTTGAANSSPWVGGNVTSLICGENSHPMAQYASSLNYPTVHVASWPQHFSPELAMRECIRIASRGLAYSLKTFVLNSVTTISEQMVEAYGYAGADSYLRDPDTFGRASIVAPWGEILVEAEDDTEQLVVIDIDPSAVIVPKMVHDVAGHYDRPDIWGDVLQR
jgi:aliphatic nitrilase